MNTTVKSEKKVLKNVILENYPTDIINHDESDSFELTHGDLHANTIKLIFNLIENGILGIKEDDYKELVKIYQKGKRITKEDIDKFDELLEKAELKNKNASLRLIGDTLADRGKNDLLTIILLNKLKKKGLKFTNIFSNHDLEFLADYYSGFPIEGFILKKSPQIGSFLNIKNLVSSEAIPKTFIDDFMNHTYLPSLKLIDYSVDTSTTPKKFFIYSHAPVGLEILNSLSGKTSEYNSIEDIIKAIDYINSIFQNTLKHKPENIVALLENSSEWMKVKKKIIGEHPVPSNLGLLRIVWNRIFNKEKDNEITTPKKIGDYVLFFVHGHEGYGVSKNDSMINLDNIFGKAGITENASKLELDAARKISSDAEAEYGLSYFTTPSNSNVIEENIKDDSNIQIYDVDGSIVTLSMTNDETESVLNINTNTREKSNTDSIDSEDENSTNSDSENENSTNSDSEEESTTNSEENSNTKMTSEQPIDDETLELINMIAQETNEQFKKEKEERERKKIEEKDNVDFQFFRKAPKRSKKNPKYLIKKLIKHFKS